VRAGLGAALMSLVVGFSSLVINLQLPTTYRQRPWPTCRRIQIWRPIGPQRLAALRAEFRRPIHSSSKSQRREEVRASRPPETRRPPLPVARKWPPISRIGAPIESWKRKSNLLIGRPLAR